MKQDKEKAAVRSELKVEGLLTEKGVKVSEKQGVDELSQRGYGTSEDNALLLTFYEALYLLDKGWMEVFDKKTKVDFQSLLHAYESTDENAWAKYLAYRDLRGRGYVIREGFGLGVDFRAYDRGEYGKDTAKFLVLSLQEGKPITMEDLAHVLKQSQSLKKELILAVMNRRGETVYYSVSQLTVA
jgi:tRNA-intron endonuclease